MNEQGQEFEMSNQTWKINFNVRKQIIDGENENEQEQTPLNQEVSMVSVQILKVPDQEKFCVNFTRKAGSSILFYDSANKYIDLLELCNNTTLDE